MLEKTPESPLDFKEIKPVNLTGNQPWILIGRNDAEAEAPVFWSPDAKSRLTRKVPDAGENWGQKEKRYMRIWDPENMVCMSKNIQYDSIEITRMYSRITEEPVKGKLEKEGFK